MFRSRERRAPTDSHTVNSNKGLAYGYKYPHRLNLYDIPPVEDITLEDFEVWAIDRLRILGEIESSLVRNRTYDEMRNVTTKQCKKYLPLNSSSATSVDREEERRKDHVSHFVLRLAFCRSEELRRRFVKAEMMLFRVRFETDDHSERESFIQSLNFGWMPVDEEEKKQLQAELVAASPATFLSLRQVPWTRVPDLVEKRRVFLKNGMAYVPAREQSSMVYQEFQTNLEKQLQLTAKALPRLDEDGRILPILENLSQGFIAGVPSEYSSPEGSGDAVTADMINDMSQKHFPLCMRNLHDTLRKDRHLKHYGRLQYGLFLKVIGLSIEEALIFWRKGFGGTMTDDKFNKEYRYNIRHSFGLEGKRHNYPAWSCQQILMGHQPGVQESHGCPFRHFSSENLDTALLSTFGPQGVTSNDIPEIMSQVKSTHYHVACTRVFELTHGLKKGEGIGGGESVTHPNQYATRSRELENGNKKSGDAMLVDT
ncbi:DNA primase large subunit [Hysterangium stoloniferum]|nr:DNA primase large subunit [Hysterangium stoloniferum]